MNETFQTIIELLEKGKLDKKKGKQPPTIDMTTSAPHIVPTNIGNDKRTFPKIN